MLTRFSTEPWADLLAQAAGVEADVVVVTDSFVRSTEAGPPADPAFTLTIAQLSDRPVIAGASVGVVADGGADGRVAIVLGSAVAAHLTGTLHVAVPDGGRTARRVSSALGPLRTGGLDVRLVDATDEALASDLVLLAGGGAFAADLVATPGVGTVVRVHAGLDDRESELAEQLAKLAETP